MPADASLTARVRDAAGAHLRAAAEHVVPLPFGWAVLTPTVPHWWDLNMVVVDRPAPDLDAEALAVVCDDVLVGLPHRTAEVWEPESADRLCPDGWERDPFVLLAHTGAIPAVPADVVEVAREEVAPLRREWLAASMPAELLPQAAIGEARTFTATPTRAFAVRQDGEPVATALLVGVGPVQMVEDVYTTPRHRRRGLGARVVRAAMAAAYAAGAEVVWLATEDDGPAVPLYERLGFAAVTRATRCARR